MAAGIEAIAFAGARIMSSSVLIDLQHVSKTFASVKALADVSFSIEKGVVHALMGETALANRR